MSNWSGNNPKPQQLRFYPVIPAWAPAGILRSIVAFRV